MLKSEFELYRQSAFYGAYSYAANGLCSFCRTEAEWMRAKKAYCEDCKTKSQSKEMDKLRLSKRQLHMLRLMYEGAELHEDLTHGGDSYVINVLVPQEDRIDIQKLEDRRKLERKGVIQYSRSIGTIQIYEISNKGRRAVERRAI